MRLTKTTLLLLTGLTLAACKEQAKDPKTVADQYWQYLQSGNTVEAKKLVTLNSRPLFDRHAQRVDSNTQVKNGDARTIVTTTITTINPQDNTRTSTTFETVLVLEQGHWKVDIEQSVIPPVASTDDKELDEIAEQLSESLEKNMQTMDEAVEHGLKMLNDAMKEGEKEMSKSMLELMEELNRTMEESVEQMKKRREQQQPPQLPAPDPTQGEGAI
ncbi:MAG TPA: hypothetical protein ENJ11_08800 [Gammaproteobacteria bacterium]|nr:hypothetical protein [Gammaproteobacteria bacterium]